MKAEHIMTRDVVSVRKEATISDVAQLLLKNHISAAPVVDERGAPIGMVSEGDLVGRSDEERLARRDWWLALLAEGHPIAPEFLATLRMPSRTAGEVMSKPVITVAPDTEASEVARLLQSHRIKRVPVMQDGHMVGIVSRQDLLRTIAAA
ncbi:MAG: CBS domain-containing protein [Alphaproteobacteria bacterium]|nr:CBS domain-containing protein [Alphaproteobacteria bacterium]MBV8407933.1 CBS domain-containing protein [Alphaproteobacteria bacterium]